MKTFHWKNIAIAFTCVYAGWIISTLAVFRDDMTAVWAAMPALVTLAVFALLPIVAAGTILIVVERENFRVWMIKAAARVICAAADKKDHSLIECIAIYETVEELRGKLNQPAA
ncbi:MAG: hypothetical protein LBT97_03030 [Planctomycetota bacterium]|jgi:hypothetical protein|nr:hypothetical protein [Planctomycetota bacterium]